MSNQYRILVDITNSVMSSSRHGWSYSEVSKEIHRFFGLNHISLMLCVPHHKIVMKVFFILVVIRLEICHSPTT